MAQRATLLTFHLVSPEIIDRRLDLQNIRTGKEMPPYFENLITKESGCDSFERWFIQISFAVPFPPFPMYGSLRLVQLRFSLFKMQERAFFSFFSRHHVVPAPSQTWFSADLHALRGIIHPPWSRFMTYLFLPPSSILPSFYTSKPS